MIICGGSALFTAQTYKRKPMKTIIALLLLSISLQASEAELITQIEKLRLQNESIEAKLNKSSDVKIGGYGELIYNAYSNNSSRSQMDFRRFVLFVGKSFNEKLSFNSEIEWEHAVVGPSNAGETALEQAYINYQFSPDMSLKAGLFLMPFGFINEAHEPPVFYGVERNEIETRIIPSTWREGGVSLSGNTAGNLDWSVGLVTAFDSAKFSDAGKPLRALRQKLELAKARDLALFATLNYRTPGLVIGTALYSGDSMQGNADFNSDSTLPNFSGINARVNFGDVHARWQQSGWDVQALLAKGTIADADLMNQILQTYNTANSTSLPFLASEFYGWLTQAAYVFSLSENATLAPFIRYEEFDSQAKMPAGFSASASNIDHVTTAGFSYKPHTDVVFKTDYQNYNNTSTRNRFNLGMGYMF